MKLFNRNLLVLGVGALLAGCGGGNAGLAVPSASAVETGDEATVTAAASTPGRGFPVGAPWASCYGPSDKVGDLKKAASAFRIINIDADPDGGNFTTAQIQQLKNNGQNRVISYLNIGSCESFRSYWSKAPAPYVAAKNNRKAWLGLYDGYPDETWMDLSNADYQNLIVNYVAPRLVAQGVDGFFLDNMELVEHGPKDKNGPCSAACRQGGLDLIAKLRRKYPRALIVMQNATSDVTRLGKTGGVAFPTLLDGISHEEVFAPVADAQAQTELKAWKAMNLLPGGQAFWIGTEDYVGRASSTALQKKVYAQSRAMGFSPYCADESGKQQTFFYWPN
ncbi:glycoside hydrolase [bacterium]|nr:MAG: glycoside hydrolase [bacterium]